MVEQGERLTARERETLREILRPYRRHMLTAEGLAALERLFAAYDALVADLQVRSVLRGPRRAVLPLPV